MTCEVETVEARPVGALPGRGQRACQVAARASDLQPSIGRGRSRHRDEYEAVSGEAAEKITAALFVCLVSDGWSGVQKRHVLNLILTTPEPVFLGNVETKEASVDGKFQAELFTNTIMANGGPAKVPAICTDNASVMRKTWRLLREKFHGLFTYGCAPHAFNLHAKDICAMPQFAKLNDNTNTIVTWFNKHLQADGRATLTRIQLDIYGKEKALVKAGATRWNSQVSAAESVLDNRAALTTLVTERDFDTSKPGAKDLKKLIVDVDDEYWSLLSEWVDMMQPLRLAIHCMQADYATLSDVFASFVRVHRGMNETFDEARCETFATLRRAARSKRSLPSASTFSTIQFTWWHSRSIRATRHTARHRPP